MKHYLLLLSIVQESRDLKAIYESEIDSNEKENQPPPYTAVIIIMDRTCIVVRVRVGYHEEKATTWNGW